MTATGGTNKASNVRKLVGGGVAAVAVVTGMFAVATPAFAATYWETQTDGATGVSAWGTSTVSSAECDISMHIKDTKGDGHRAGVQVQYSDINDGDGGVTNYYRYNTAGSGTTVDRSVWDIPNYFGISVYVREFVSEGAIESGGYFVDRGDWVRVC